MRVAIGGYSHETNTFSNSKTYLDSFKLRSFTVFSGIFFGKEIISYFKSTRTVFGGIIDSSRIYNFEIIPTFFAGALPSGIVAKDTFTYIENSLIDSICKADDFDGILLHLHGAMVVEDEDDPEGHTLEFLRDIVGKKTPVVLILDYHGNISEKMVKNADVIIGYKTCPHTDYYERGIEGGKVIASIIRKDIKPTMAFRKPPMLISSEKQYTIHPPMKIMILTANELEKKEDVINVTVNAGFPYADTPKTGPGIIVTTNNSQGLAEELAELLKNLAWTLRKSFLPSLTSVENTMHIVKNSQEKSIILADYGDNVMGGGPGDGTVLLKLLLESQEDGACVIYDPQAVNEAVQAGVGKEIELTIGGKTDLLHGEPIKTKGYIRLISDGKYFSEYVQGVEVKMGRTVVFKSGKTEIIITENKTPQFDPQLFLSVGIDPSKKKILVLKSQHAFRVLFGQFAKEVIEVDTPGITGNIKRLIYHKVQRPIFPIDDNSIG